MTGIPTLGSEKKIISLDKLTQLHLLAAKCIASINLTFPFSINNVKLSNELVTNNVIYMRIYSTVMRSYDNVLWNTRNQAGELQFNIHVRTLKQIHHCRKQVPWIILFNFQIHL